MKKMVKTVEPHNAEATKQHKKTTTTKSRGEMDVAISSYSAKGDSIYANAAMVKEKQSWRNQHTSRYLIQ